MVVLAFLLQQNVRINLLINKRRDRDARSRVPAPDLLVLHLDPMTHNETSDSMVRNLQSFGKPRQRRIRLLGKGTNLRLIQILAYNPANRCDAKVAWMLNLDAFLFHDPGYSTPGHHELCGNLAHRHIFILGHLSNHVNVNFLHGRRMQLLAFTQFEGFRRSSRFIGWRNNFDVVYLHELADHHIRHLDPSCDLGFRHTVLLCQLLNQLNI